MNRKVFHPLHCFSCNQGQPTLPVYLGPSLVLGPKEYTNYFDEKNADFFQQIVSIKKQYQILLSELPVIGNRFSWKHVVNGSQELDFNSGNQSMYNLETPIKTGIGLFFIPLHLVLLNIAIFFIFIAIFYVKIIKIFGKGRGKKNFWRYLWMVPNVVVCSKWRLG